MIDYSSIPLHIRCRDREKIDDAYPEDGLSWWRTQTGQRMGAEQVIGKTDTRLYPVNDKTRETVYRLVMERGPVTMAEITKCARLTYSSARNVITGMTQVFPVFEYTENGVVFIDSLERANG